MVRRSRARKSCRKGMRGRKIMGGRKRKTFRRKSTRRRRRRGGERFKKSKRSIDKKERACSKTFFGQDRTNSKACLAARENLRRRDGYQAFKEEEEEGVGTSEN